MNATKKIVPYILGGLAVAIILATVVFTLIFDINPHRKAKRFIQGGKCEVFYKGSVRQPFKMIPYSVIGFILLLVPDLP
jgi:hypothetical protein